MYTLLRNILFLFPTEQVHHFSMNILRICCQIDWLKKILISRYGCGNKNSPRELFGLRFKNPVGLAAGFDKNALYLQELETLGFGFVEIGTVTPLAQPGNPRPRLFRLPQDKALINRMGFNNQGVVCVAKRLRKWREQKARDGSPGIDRLIIGGNIGKNKNTANEDAWKDYETSFQALFDCIDYFVVNISSPNTPQLRELQQKSSLRKILVHLQELNQHLALEKKEKSKPLLLKISPDMTAEELDDVIELAMEIHLDGLVVANTTVSRNTLSAKSFSKAEKIGLGGLSGLPLASKSTELIGYISAKTQGRIPLIGSGGVFHSSDAREKITAGASLVQVWTGFIYEGPGIVKKLLPAFSL
jgi:dihydroorotate dehydrogenase